MRYNVGMKLLRGALFMNGLFSLKVGISILIQAKGIAEDVVKFPPLVLVFIGIGLAIFGTSVLALSIKPNFRGTLVVTLLDLLWVVFTLLLLATSLVPTKIGFVIILVTSSLVLMFAVLQVIGLNRGIKQPNGKRRICFSFKVNSDADTFWNRISKLEDIAQYIPDLASSTLVQGTSLSTGTIRECVDVADQRWQEEVFETGEKSFTLRFLTEAEDYPYPLTDMTGGWSVHPATSGAIVKVWWEARGKGKMPEWLLFPMMAAKAEGSTPKIIACLDSGQPTENQRKGARYYPALGC